MARERILIVKLSSLGDLFHALPTVHCLKTGLDAEIDWVTQPEYVELMACFPDVSGAIPFPRRDFLSGLVPFVRAVRARDYDLVIDLQGLLKSAVAARLAHGLRVIGPSFHRECAHWLYHAVAGPRDKARHAVEESLDVVRYLGLPCTPVQFPVRFPPHRAEPEGPRVALVPVSRGAHKNWPLEKFIETARGLRDRTGAALYLFGARSDQPACEAIRTAVDTGPAGPRVENLAGRTSLVEMGSRLATMDLVVSNDSGPIHMAAAIGVPVLAIFGPTDPGRTGPYGSGHRVITESMDCQPCFRRTCAQGVPECLARMTPERVVAEAVDMLGVKRP
jgi:heptosyltransferase-1